MKRRKKNYKKEAGNAILVTIILLLIISILVMTCVNLAASQVKIADLNRDTSNTYLLARDGIEKEVDTINKALEEKIPDIVQALGKEYIDNQLKMTEATSEANEIKRYKEAKYY